MNNFPQICDIPDKDGITDRQRNSDKKHQLRIGDLVELDNGCRSFIAKLCRDCDQTPLYRISHGTSHTEGGYPEDSLKLIKRGE